MDGSGGSDGGGDRVWWGDGSGSGGVGGCGSRGGVMRKLSLSAWVCVSAAAVIVLGVAWNQTRPGFVAVAAVNDPVLDGAIEVEAQRLRASAGSDAQCVADSAAIVEQGAKDKAIVSCFLSRLRQENRSAIGRELFRMKALEVAGDG